MASQRGSCTGTFVPQQASSHIFFCWVTWRYARPKVPGACPDTALAANFLLLIGAKCCLMLAAGKTD